MASSVSLMGSLFVIVVSASSGFEDGDIVKDYADLIEYNHFYDDTGQHAYDQIIFYDWSPDYRRFHVIAWFLIEGDLSKIPQRRQNGRYTSRWYDRDAKSWREVRACLFRETWTNKDPERENQRLFDEKYRRSLQRSSYQIEQAKIREEEERKKKEMECQKAK